MCVRCVSKGEVCIGAGMVVVFGLCVICVLCVCCCVSCVGSVSVGVVVYAG